MVIIPIYFVASIIWSRVLTPIVFSIWVSAVDDGAADGCFLAAAAGLGDFFPPDALVFSGLAAGATACNDGSD